MKTFIFSALIAILVWISWFFLAGPNPFIYIQNHWEVSLTMVFGSLIAGGTSEGGGAIAFPVFTKLLQIPPTEAKIFSLAIQSVGMSAAALVIIYMKIRIEWRVILWASLGGLLGMVLSLNLLTPILPPPMLKMSFTAMITSFAITLLVLNHYQAERFYHICLSHFSTRVKLWLLAAGFFGGIMGGLVGNGIDIITFSVMVLLFRISEKIATPTSVVLMAINALTGFALHLFVLGGFTPQVQAYWLSAVPIVVVGAPMGAIICSLLNRLTIVRVLIALILVELITSLWLIPLTWPVIVVGLMTFLFFSSLYYWMYRQY